MKNPKKTAWINDALHHTPLSVKTRAMKQFLLGKKDYLPKKKTHADLDAIIKCALCPNMCRFDCPVSEAAKTETLTPSGRTRTAFLYETDALSNTDTIDILYTCCHCDACRQWCPFDYSVGDILQGVHQDITTKNTPPRPVIELQQNLTKNHILNPRTIQPTPPKTGDIMYYMGCSVQADHPEIATAMNTLFTTLDHTYTYENTEWCCGAPLYKLGYHTEFLEFARHHQQLLKERNCTKLICSCPTCTHMFRVIYPQQGINLPVDIMHTTEYLAANINTLKPHLTSLKGTYTYHDPCTLSRKLKVLSPPHTILEAIPDIVIKKPYLRGKETQCCGYGSSLSHTHPDLANTITKKRITELHREADHIITACPTCKTAFEKNNCLVTDITELTYQSVKPINE